MRTARRLTALGSLVLALVILALGPSDVALAENLVIEWLLDAMASGGDVTPALAWLPLTTWLKWLAIGASLCALAPVLRGWARGVVAVPLPLTLLALASGLPVVAEAMALAVNVAFIVLIGLAWWGAWRSAPATTPPAPS